MKKKNLYILLTLTLGVLGFPLEGATNNQPAPQTKAPSTSPTAKTTKTHDDVEEEEEEYNIMKRDQIDNTNTLAIPLDDSEIEDEEEIDRAERSNTFPLPHSR